MVGRVRVLARGKAAATPVFTQKADNNEEAGVGDPRGGAEGVACASDTQVDAQGNHECGQDPSEGAVGWNDAAGSCSCLA